MDGNLSEADALREVRAMLKATGYQPEPGTEGTIQTSTPTPASA